VPWKRWETQIELVARVVARKEQARAAAAAATEKVNNDIKSAENTATRNWNAVRAKVAADINTLKADVAHKKHDLVPGIKAE
jgi:fibrillarin-like rRNA methylase